MFEFITTVNKQCQLFKPFVEAHKRDIAEKSRVLKEVEDNKIHEDEEYRITQELEKRAEEDKEILEEQKRRIQDALNRQTFAQFKVYAEQQYPGNPEQVRVRPYATIHLLIGFSYVFFIHLENSNIVFYINLARSFN